MKKFLFLLLCLVATILNDIKAQTTIKGLINNNDTTRIVSLTKLNDFLDYENEIIGTSTIDNIGNFTISCATCYGVYELVIGNNYLPIFINKNTDLSLVCDLKNVDSTVVYTGANASDNQYIANEVLEKYSEKKRKFLFEKDPTIFRSKLDSLQLVHYQFLEQNASKLSKEFYDFKKLEIKYSYLVYIRSYRFTTMDSNNNTVEKPRPDNFDGYLKTLDLNDVKAKDQVAYYTVLSKAIEHLSGLNYKEDGLSKKYFLQYEIIKNSSYADYAMAHILKHFINYNYQDSKPTIDSLFEHYKSKFNNKLYLDNLATSHESANNILKGKPAPAIDLMDEFGNNFSLNQLLGSYVYVDFWATWCGPCISSMKHAPPIIEEYNPKNIKFLYVNCWDSKAQWETYLKKDTKLNGIHVFANEEQTKALRKKYNFNGIPRYIIIGKQGEIIDSEAERPNKIKPVFDELLKGGK